MSSSFIVDWRDIGGGKAKKRERLVLFQFSCNSCTSSYHRWYSYITAWHHNGLWEVLAPCIGNTKYERGKSKPCPTELLHVLAHSFHLLDVHFRRPFSEHQNRATLTPLSLQLITTTTIIIIPTTNGPAATWRTWTWSLTLPTQRCYSAKARVSIVGTTWRGRSK